MKLKIPSYILITILLLSLNTNVLANCLDTYDSTEDVYQYPDIVGNEYSHQEMIELFRIPQEKLSEMSTRNLLCAVIDYPLWPIIYVYDDLQAGYNNLYYSCDALRELISRPDGLNELNRLELLLQSQSEDEDGNVRDYRGKVVLKQFVRDLCLVSRKTLWSSDGEYNQLVRTGELYVYTPQNSAVLYYDYTSLPQWNAYWKQYYNTWAQTYYSVQVIRDPNKYYNCHSYAWYSTASNNTVWIPDPERYMHDGSYYQSYFPYANYKVFIHNNGTEVGNDGNTLGDHSGIIYSVSGSNIIITSKWGSLGLYRHNLYNSPYSGNFTQYSFWVLDEE